MGSATVCPGLGKGFSDQVGKGVMELEGRAQCQASDTCLHSPWMPWLRFWPLWEDVSSRHPMFSPGCGVEKQLENWGGGGGPPGGGGGRGGGGGGEKGGGEATG